MPGSIGSTQAAASRKERVWWLGWIALEAHGKHQRHGCGTSQEGWGKAEGRCEAKSRASQANFSISHCEEDLHEAIRDTEMRTQVVERDAERSRKVV